MAWSVGAGAGAAAARGTLLGFLLRILSFFLTQLTVRFVDPVTLGRASIRLELLLSTSLFLGREGFRLALTKTKSDDHDWDSSGGKDYSSANNGKTVTLDLIDADRLTNVSWLSLPAGLAASAVALAFHLRWCHFVSAAMSSGSHEAHDGGEDHTDVYDEQSLRDFRLAGILYCLASLVEMLAEPLVIGCMKALDVESRAKAEGSAAIARAASLVALLSDPVSAVAPGLGMDWSGAIAKRWPVTAFGLSQMVHSIVLVSVLYKRKWRSIRWPKYVFAANESISKDSREVKEPKPQGSVVSKGSPSFLFSFASQNFDLEALRLVVIFTVQSVFKHALTEGDRIVLTTLSGSYDQGIYAMASSYGGLASRLLLQPLEENARLLFARQHALLSSAEEKIDRDGTGNEQEQQRSTAARHLEALRSTYATVLRLVLYIGFLFACVASNYTSILLRILAGRRWGSNPDAAATLSAFCLFTALLSLNGTTEAFVYGVASQGGEVGELGIAHAAVGGLFAAAAPAMAAEWGTVGLVGANCAAMAVRSLYSLNFAARYFCRRYEMCRDTTERGNLVTALTLPQMMVELLRWVIPHPAVLAGYLVSYGVTRLSLLRFLRSEEGLDLTMGLTKAWLVVAVKHIGAGCLCVFALAVIAFHFEKEFGNAVKSMVRPKED